MDKKLVKYIALMILSIPISIVYNLCVEKIILYFYDKGEIIYSPGFSFVCGFLSVVLCCYFICKYISDSNSDSKYIKNISVFLFVVIIFLLIFPFCEIWVINEDKIVQNIFGKEIHTYFYDDVSSVELDVVSTGIKIHSSSLRYQVFFTNNTSQEFILNHAFTENMEHFISFDKTFSSKRNLIVLSKEDIYNACSNIGFSEKETNYFSSVPFTTKHQNENYGIIFLDIILVLFNILTFRKYIRKRLTKKELKEKMFIEKIFFIDKFGDINKFLWFGNFLNVLFSAYLIILFIVNVISENNYLINDSIIICFGLLCMDSLAFLKYEKPT